jgi:hypothetical protein
MNEDDLRDLNDAIDELQEAYFYLEGCSPQLRKKMGR